MTKLSLVFSLLTVFSANVFAADPNALYRVRSHISNINANIQNMGQNLSDSQLAQIEQELRNIDMLMVTAPMPYPPQPLPPPQPVPQPPYPQPVPPPIPQPNPRMLIEGTISGREFRIQADDLGEVLNQCAPFITSNNIAQTDTIEVSFNLGPIQSIHNGPGYWVGANAICDQVIGAARNAGLRAPPPFRGRVVYGSISGKDFRFQGDLLGLDNQCEAFVRQSNIAQTDTVITSTDFQPSVVRHNGPGYWSNPMEICQQVLADAH